YRLMRRADGLAAAGTLRHLVHAHRLVGAALTVLPARRTQAAAPLRRRRVALPRVPVAHDPAAVAARRETRGAGRVPVPLGAETLVRRAVLQPARRADAHVRVTRRLSIHPALGDAVVRAEVLGAYRATVRARLAGAVVLPADDKHRRWATALRARHAPGRRTGRAQGPLGAEGGVMPAGRGRLVPQVRQQELEQLRGLPRRDARRGRRNGRIGGRDPARLEVPERRREIVAQPDAG